jgi:serine/threonine protein kinase
VIDDDTILSALAPLNADQTLGRYQLLTPIGRGGMAVVWAARQTGSRGFSKMVAIKVMLPHLSADPRFERMFLKEAEIASRIRHANVCEILDLGEEDKVLYLAMEWVDGDPLTLLLGAGLPVDVLAHIVAEAGRGLAAAHALGVVHRDVSPQNVLTTVDGRVKIVDFGVAKAATFGDQTTQSGFLKGKVGYVAPEQVNSVDADERTDVFALGVVLYELTTGVHPFRGPTDLATLLAVASTDPATPPSEQSPDYPPALEAIVMRALQKDAAHRYPSMDDFARDLDAFVGDAAAIRSRTQDALRAALDERRLARAARLEKAEQAFEARKKKPVLTPPRETRHGVLIASVLALALGVGIGTVGRFGNATPAIAVSDDTPPPVTPVAVVPALPESVTPVVQQPEAAPSARRRIARPASRPVEEPAPSAPTAPPAPSTATGPRFREPGF